MVFNFIKMCFKVVLAYTAMISIVSKEKGSEVLMLSYVEIYHVSLHGGKEEKDILC